MERDPWIALDDGAAADGAGTNVIRIPVKRQANIVESASLERDVAQAGDGFVHLIDEIADAVAKNNARSETLARRAVSALQRAEARICGLEAELAAAQSRLAESDRLIARLHDTVREKFGRFASPTSAA